MRAANPGKLNFGTIAPGSTTASVRLNCSSANLVLIAAVVTFSERRRNLSLRYCGRMFVGFDYFAPFQSAIISSS